MPRAVLHIGTEKTGTSSLQDALAAARDDLREAGIAFPPVGAGNWHIALAAYANIDGEPGDLPLLAGWGPAEDRAAFEARIEAELAAAVAEQPDALFVFSTEHASSRLVTRDAVAHLKALLERHFDRIDIAVYLRRWDRMAVSAYSTMVRHGQSDPFDFDRVRNEFCSVPGYLEFADMLDRWESVFGHERMHVAIYDRAEMAEGSVVADFCDRFGIPRVAETADSNRALDAVSLLHLRLINRLLADACPSEAQEIRQEVERALPRRSAGLPVSRAQAEAFVQGFADQAERIRKRYFPARTSLFDTEFSEYPEVAAPVKADWKAVAQALASVAGSINHSKRTALAGREALQAILQLREGEIEPARDSIHRAILSVPQSPQLLGLLARVESTRGNRRAARIAARRAASIRARRKARKR